ncbi:NUDIX domain-containing protein [Methylopila sp. Yamaguchi]|uniref:NUDIX domain-containing protein n=1 Tax=Methylopila sp. Yamaguchi TaxID=1437817 RepID=UPI000CA66B05|nr:NUDIX domain-containing protein [Methylopila sp. Yamaguchi]GBD48382.1 NUDIX hydrolase [Methylopila sp. Yamaguchi]
MLKSRVLSYLVARYGRMRRAMTLGVRVAAFDAEGRVLLVRHGYAPGWHLPGGAVDPGESAHEAAIRELVEETGVVAGDDVVLHGLHFNPGFGGRDHVATFVTRAVRIGPEPPPNREIAERRWCRVDDLPEDVTPATRRRLLEIVGAGAGAGRW